MEIIKLIQKYVDGESIYIPRKEYTTYYSTNENHRIKNKLVHVIVCQLILF